jgi:hypothetical protein
MAPYGAPFLMLCIVIKPDAVIFKILIPGIAISGYTALNDRAFKSRR